MSSSFRRAPYSYSSTGKTSTKIRTQSYIQDGPLVKILDGFKYFRKSAPPQMFDCGVKIYLWPLPQKSIKKQLSNILSEVLNNLVSIHFLK